MSSCAKHYTNVHALSATLVIDGKLCVQARLDEALEERRKAKADAEALKAQSKVHHHVGHAAVLMGCKDVVRCEVECVC